MKTQLQPDFQCGETVKAVSGKFFPDFEITTLSDTRGSTSGDSSTVLVLEVGDPRALFITYYRGTTRENVTRPVSIAAMKLCEQPIPKGWTLVYSNQGEVWYQQTSGTLGTYLCELVAQDTLAQDLPKAIPPAV